MRQADNLTDINNILPLVKKQLRKQNEKGLAKYGTALKDNDLTVLELLDHSIEEKVDDLQYTIIARERVIELEERWEKLKEHIASAGRASDCDLRFVLALIVDKMNELERGEE
ncbi:hypothetical protein ERX37_07895 [Macrococcus hajekii]|uniref:Uncharacterized protein n=1 Tax=Macrococcus hajekii TaxID=198482 RepID=A0A4R6BIF4_9STAP|nr:hypothetical protein [Macrococcus hajekii]TDM01415.1 hypothetical protein ERX37_07895 [Macrococcus hajekii]GGA99767.1 hypothetical protein GCM10007190_04790 [Macrococcus hajekii]